MRQALYLIGEPGSGKSTLARALTVGLRGSLLKKPCEHIVWDTPAGAVLELGGRRGAFSGTDTLSMSVMSRALALAEATPLQLLFAEGDRLANERFLVGLRARGWALAVVHLAPPSVVAAAWREERAQRLGTKKQDATWVQGRITKVERLAMRYATRTIVHTEPEERLAELVAASPVARALRS